MADILVRFDLDERRDWRKRSHFYPTNFAVLRTKAAREQQAMRMFAKKQQKRRVYQTAKIRERLRGTSARARTFTHGSPT